MVGQHLEKIKNNLFFCMKDFHIIIWPSLPALFSGEFQFPGQDRYTVLGWLFLDLSWNRSGKNMNSEGISHDLHFYGLGLVTPFMLMHAPHQHLHWAAWLNAAAPVHRRYKWDIITSMAASPEHSNPRWLTGMFVSDTSHLFQDGAVAPLLVFLQNVLLAVIPPRILKCYLGDQQGGGFGMSCFCCSILNRWTPYLRDWTLKWQRGLPFHLASHWEMEDSV